MQRRQLLGFATASAACAALVGLPKAGWGRMDWPADPFSAGVASGSPTSHSIVLWSRLGREALAQTGLSASPVSVTWQLANDAKFSDIVQQGTLLALPERGHSLHAEPIGLSPGHHYFYRFLTGHATSPIGQTRTFPSPAQTPSRLRIAYASCQRWGDGFYSAYRDMREQQLDVVMFLGDYIYEYPASHVRDLRPTPGGWVLTLDDYRDRYALHHSDLHLQAMRASCPWVVTWDDHEVQNDYAQQQAGFSGAYVPDFATRRRWAYQAFYENMPVRYADFASLLARQSDQVQVYGSIPFGQLATLYTLDNRQYRHRQVCTPGNRTGGGRIDPSQCPALYDTDRSLLGTRQEAWLSRQFESSTARWNIIGQQSLLGPRHSGASEPTLSNDGWGGYPAARQRFIDALQATQLNNPVVLGGDVHQNWVGHILADYAKPDSPSIGVEFCGTSITSRTLALRADVENTLRHSPHFSYANTEYRGYGIVECTPHDITTTLRAVQHVRDPNSAVTTLAKFSVEAGRSKIYLS